MQITITIPTPHSILRSWKWALLAALVLTFGLLVGGESPAAAAGNTVVSGSAGRYHACALTGAGGLKCWGDNQAGN